MMEQNGGENVRTDAAGGEMPVGLEGRLVGVRLLRPEDRIFDLVDRVEDPASEGRTNHEIMVIDGRVYERVSRNGKVGGDMLEASRDKGVVFDEIRLREEIARQVGDVARQVAREMFPGIAERIIREEIARLKQEDAASD